MDHSIGSTADSAVRQEASVDDAVPAERGGSRDVADLPPAARDALVAQRSSLVETARFASESPLIKSMEAQQAQLARVIDTISIPDLTPTAELLASVAAAMDPWRQTIARIHTQMLPLADVARVISQVVDGGQLRAAVEAVAAMQTQMDGIRDAVALASGRQAAFIQFSSNLTSFASTALDGWHRTLDSAVLVPPRSPRPLGWLGESALEVTEIATEFVLDDPEVSVPAESSIWREGRVHLTDELAQWLGIVCPKVVPKLQGAWHALASNGPDAASQAANSGVEVLDWTLRTLAPEAELLAWREGAGAHKDDLDERTGRPTRPLRVRYIVREQGLDAGGVAMVVGAVSATLKELQKVKHGGDPTKTVHAVRRGLLALENALLALMPER